MIAPVGMGDTVIVRVEVTEKQDRDRLLLACTCRNQHGKVVIEGEARVIAPRDKVCRPRVVLTEVHLHVQGAQYARLIAATEGRAPIRTAVVRPCDVLLVRGGLVWQCKGWSTRGCEAQPVWKNRSETNVLP
ncbi:hypothetical protein [Pseudooceanicola sediminis]|uniref:hypothetical protein n=1 Tax=Pseudooceanicola sediminis TaxID=2211117 RepID=UPI001F271B05|nr:hypothetical protein [Pseudooceanicola sediminis]